jgi:two-component system, NtrC family, sensor kinase
MKVAKRLSLKLIVAISAILIIFFSVHTSITVSNIEEYLTTSRFQDAYNISDVIKKSTRYGMLLNRREDVHQIINTIGTEEGVEEIRVYNKQGTIIYSTNQKEIFKTVNFTAEACIVCHDQSTPLTRLNSSNTMRIYEREEGRRVLGLINPIYNEKDCSSAECHAHSPENEVLGVLDVLISLDQLDENLASIRETTILNAFALTGIIGLVAGLFIIILVNKPVKKLTEGLDEIGKGNLNFRISIKSKDELGRLGESFNEMSEKLNKAYMEIREWSDNLNKKVDEKSEELKNVYSQIVQVEKLASLGKLSATVAHELNNPLEGILTYSKLITKSLKKEEGDKHQKIISFLELISEESARCGKIVKDLLLFSNSAGDAFIKGDLVQIVDKSAMLINHHLEMNKTTLTKECNFEQLELMCNPQKIQQALVALLINAIEAMPAGGEIVVTLEATEDNAIIKIKDQGTGIADKDIANIFEPFYSTKEGKGTGLGLAVVYGIVTQHKGEIKVEETSIHGTTFIIILPIIQQINPEFNNEPDRTYTYS